MLLTKADINKKMEIISNIDHFQLREYDNLVTSKHN
jgi:hypothetical protein